MGLKDWSVNQIFDDNLFRLLNPDEIIEGKIVFLRSNNQLYSLVIVSDCKFSDENTQVCKTEAKYYQDYGDLYTFK